MTRAVSTMTRAELEEEVVWLRDELGLTPDKAALAKIRAKRFSPMEAEVLYLLWKAGGAVRSSGQIEDAMRLHAKDNDTHTPASIAIFKLRRKLGAEMIDNIRSEGFRLSRSGLEAVTAIVEVRP